MKTTPHIRIANARDLAYVVDLQRQWSNALGWLPRCAHKRYINAQRVLIATFNGQRAGFCNMIISKKGLLRLPQIAISTELLRQGVGSSLMDSLTGIATASRCSAIRLTTRADLDANLFWPTTGFEMTLMTYPDNARRQPLLEWTQSLMSPWKRALNA